MKSSLHFLLLCTCCFFTSLSQTALGHQPELESPAADEQRVMLTSRIELDRLVDLTAQLNRVEIEYPTNALRGKVITLRLTHELNRFELWELCLTILQKEEFTIVRRDGDRGLYSVVTIASAASDSLPQSDLESVGLMPGYQSVIIPLKRVSAEEMLDRVGSMITKGHKINIKLIEGVDGVVVSGVYERVRVVSDLVHKFDSETMVPEMLNIELQNRTSVEVLAEVNSITAAFKAQGASGIKSTLLASSDGRMIRVFGPAHEHERVRSLIQNADRRAPIETRVFDPRGYPLDTAAQFVETMGRDPSARGSGESWRLAQDSLTNSLIVTGTPAELEAVEKALDRLGDFPADSQRIIRMIKVHNREASKVQEIVSPLLAARVLGGSDGMLSTSRTGSDSGELLEPDERGRNANLAQASEKRADLELAVDNELNVIIATGSPRRIDQVESLVLELDVRQPQVQLEVILLSLSESETQDLGVELSGNIDTGKTLIGLGSLFGLSSVSPSSSSAQASGNGGSAVILSPGDFSAVIRAIQTVNSGRSASMPSIVVNNNETATLNSTTTQPYLTTTITDSGTTTARGGSASAGTTITVSPQIAAGDHIVLDYSFTLSSFVGESSADGVEPPSQQTSLNSVATIPDGYTIALGGIESTSEGDSKTKTPGLSEIPILGELFKSNSDSTSRSRFYVFIRATVMRNPSFEYLKYISEDLAEEVGVDDGWPEVQPRIIR